MADFYAPQPALASPLSTYKPTFAFEQEAEEESLVDTRVEVTETPPLPSSEPVQSKLDKLLSDLPWMASALNENKTISLATGECFSTSFKE